MAFDPLSFIIGQQTAKGSGGGSSDTVLLKEQTINNFTPNEEFGGLYSAEIMPPPFEFEIGKKYNVVWDGEEWECAAQDVSTVVPGSVAIGDASSFGFEGNGEPFAIVTNETGLAFFAFDTKTSHTIKIYQKAESSDDYSDVHFVTFMSGDGSTELYKRPVADGDDCADPVVRGLIDEPTKESTAQYNYTHVGWSASPNGALDSNILKAVKADKTVYANFAAVLRYYTITYYDSDGTTVLKTESLAYGSTPSYKPTKDEYDFVAWVPDAVVTGDMSYTATWKAKAVFATSSWEEIAEICNAGRAADNFKIGDVKPVTLTYADGTSETINFRIIDMGVDTDESGATTGITCMADNLVKNSTKLISVSTKSNVDIYKCDVFKTYMTDLESAFPSDLMNVVKNTRKYDSLSDTYCKIFIPSYRNLTGTAGVSTSGNQSGEYSEYSCLPQAQYTWFKSGNSVYRRKLNSGADDIYWTASPYYNKYSTYPASFRAIDPNETLTYDAGSNTTYAVCPCFCI